MSHIIYHIIPYHIISSYHPIISLHPGKQFPSVFAVTTSHFVSYSLRCSRNIPLIAKYGLGRGNILMACIMSLNKTHEPDCVFWCITNLILGIYLICWAEIGRPFAWATSAGDIASVRTYHLSDKLFCKVITAPATHSAAFTVFVVWDKDRTYYLTDEQMRDCILLFALARTRWFMDIEFTIWSTKTMCKYFFLPHAPPVSERTSLGLRDPTLRPLVLLIRVVLE